MDKKESLKRDKLLADGSADALYELGSRWFFGHGGKCGKGTACNCRSEEFGCNYWSQAVKKGHEGAKNMLKLYSHCCRNHELARQTLQDYCGEKED